MRPPRHTRSDRGAAVLTTVAVVTAAACAGLLAVVALGRSLTNEARDRRQDEVEHLVEQGVADVVGRLTSDPAEGTTALVAHPGLGTGTLADAGPWVRFGDDGRVVACDAADARTACFTVRAVGVPSLAAATELTIEVTARRCRAADAAGGSCVRARRQATIDRRHMVSEVLWVDQFGSGAVFGSDTVLEGEIRIGSGSLMTCGAAVVARTPLDLASGGTEYRLSSSSAAVTATMPGCVASAALTSSDEVAQADAVAQPQPSQDALATAAGATVSAADGTVELELWPTFARHAGGDVTYPAAGVIHVDGDLSLTMEPSTSLVRALTIVAEGDVSINGDLRVEELSGGLLGVVSLSGDVSIVVDDDGALVEALIVATAPSPAGHVATSRECTVAPCSVASVVVRGALVARVFDAPGTVGVDGLTTSGVVLDAAHDERLEWWQPPFALRPWRGGWVLRDVVSSPALSPGLS